MFNQFMKFIRSLKEVILSFKPEIPNLVSNYPYGSHEKIQTKKNTRTWGVNTTIIIRVGSSQNFLLGRIKILVLSC